MKKYKKYIVAFITGSTLTFIANLNPILSAIIIGSLAGVIVSWWYEYFDNLSIFKN